MWSSTVVCRGKETADGVADRGAPAAGGGCPGRGGPAANPDRGTCGRPGQGGRAGHAAGDRPGEVTRVLEEPAAAVPPAGQDGETSAASRPASPIAAVTVPPRQDGADASVLPRGYRDLLDVAADAGRALRRASSPPQRGCRRRRRRWRAAVEAEAAGRTGLAGPGAGRPVHAS